jgi:hypothetical protein
MSGTHLKFAQHYAPNLRGDGALRWQIARFMPELTRFFS